MSDFSSTPLPPAKAEANQPEAPSPVADWCGKRHPVDLILIGTAIIAGAVGLVAAL